MSFYKKGSYNRCHHKDYKFTLLRCDSCDLLATDPPPSNEIYEHTLDADGNFTEKNTSPWNRPLLRKVKKLKSAGRLLEIGCNDGDFVELANKNDYSAIGIEIDAKAAEYGQKLGRPIIHADFLNYDFTDKFDVIVMNHVLEHIPDIKNVPKKLSEMLKDDGVLVINVPNYKGLVARALGDSWCQLSPSTHVWFFTKKFLKSFFSEYFKQIKISTNSHCEPDGLSPLSVRVLLKYAVIQIGDLINNGDELHVVARK
jgi:2-polyprenyl-3-methyl-5-hydroxy-6-metoxy-1,4-benzoquinol methylase